VTTAGRPGCAPHRRHLVSRDHPATNRPGCCWGTRGGHRVLVADMQRLAKLNLPGYSPHTGADRAGRPDCWYRAPRSDAGRRIERRGARRPATPRAAVRPRRTAAHHARSGLASALDASPRCRQDGAALLTDWVPTIGRARRDVRPGRVGELSPRNGARGRTSAARWPGRAGGRRATACRGFDRSASWPHRGTGQPGAIARITWTRCCAVKSPSSARDQAASPTRPPRTAPAAPPLGPAARPPGGGPTGRRPNPRGEHALQLPPEPPSARAPRR